MRIRKPLIMGIFLAVFLLVQAGAQAATEPVQVTDVIRDQGRPDVHGSIITWKDKRDGNFDIYLYNILTGITEPVTTNTAIQNIPVTNGTVVVWQDQRNGNEDIYIRRPGQPEEALVSGPGNQGMPSIDGNSVVYVDDISGSRNIRMIDIETRAITDICLAAGDQWLPRISQGRVVWEDQRGGDWDIYYWDESSPANGVRLSEGDGDERVADIDGDIVVWQDYRDGQYDIWMKRLAPGAVEEPVTSNSNYQNSPRVSRDLIVWEEYIYAAATYDIYIRDLTNNTTEVLVGGQPYQTMPSIDLETVVWQQLGPNGYDIWMVNVPDVTAPRVSSLMPGAGANAGCQAPVIGAEYFDNRVGIDAASVRLELDGTDVTGAASIGDGSASLNPPVLAPGTHTATLRVADLAGNETSHSWLFTVPGQKFSLSFLLADWATPLDFANRRLSVNYRVANTSGQATAAETSIVFSNSTSGVQPLTPMPLSLGSMAPGAYVDFVFKYRVPMSVMNFNSRTYLSSRDACGVVNFFPEAPPA